MSTKKGSAQRPVTPSPKSSAPPATKGVKVPPVTASKTPASPATKGVKAPPKPTVRAVDSVEKCYTREELFDRRDKKDWGMFDGEGSQVCAECGNRMVQHETVADRQARKGNAMGAIEGGTQGVQPPLVADHHSRNAKATAPSHQPQVQTEQSGIEPTERAFRNIQNAVCGSSPTISIASHESKTSPHLAQQDYLVECFVWTTGKYEKTLRSNIDECKPPNVGITTTWQKKDGRVGVVVTMRSVARQSLDEFIASLQKKGNVSMSKQFGKPHADVRCMGSHHYKKDPETCPPGESSGVTNEM